MSMCGNRDRASRRASTFYKIPDRYETLNEVQKALRESGLESCQLIVGIDFTKSNTWTGQNTFKGQCLHEVGSTPNPYETALTIIAKTLEDFDDDHLIPCYGFGDVTTQERAVFSFNKDNAPSHKLSSLVTRYRELAKFVELSGPTSFGPLIRQAIVDVYNSGMRFHVLVILADGQVSSSCFVDTANAIVEACYFPMAIIMVGIGDGPWEAMRQFDNDLPRRPWDNFQFVQFDRLFNNRSYNTPDRREAGFATHALMEVPDQFKICEACAGENQAASADTIAQIKASVTLKQPPFKAHSAEVFNQVATAPEFSPDDYGRVFRNS